MFFRSNLQKSHLLEIKGINLRINPFGGLFLFLLLLIYRV
ncbi:hypothetical protein yberc0001_11850 [Yersinia bercovieri ATCC 43970]|uniref:Uncharacterized protein n=1 Tax=Yersinia bercovieri ATCC 43970 TaxID=349968 RepID=A0ABP2E101_YERBE|nr:hypothetical protein yberc0001_11850 [Yersinia bercovieri ATCC 43970]